MNMTYDQLAFTEHKFAWYKCERNGATRPAHEHEFQLLGSTQSR